MRGWRATLPTTTSTTTSTTTTTTTTCTDQTGELADLLAHQRGEVSMARTQHQLVLQTKVHNGVDSDKSRGSILNMSTTSGETEIQLHLHLLLVVELLLQLQETRMLESLLHLQGGKLEAEQNRLKSSQNLLICWKKRLKP